VAATGQAALPRPTIRPLSIAALVLAHRDIHQVERLAERLDVPVWVHLDAKSTRADHARLAASARLRAVSDPVRVRWGHWSTIIATLRGLMAVRGDPDHVLLLSGQTYPVKPPPLLDTTLADASYVRYVPLPYDRWGRDGGLSRITFRHVPRPRFLPDGSRVPRMIRLPGRRSLPPWRLYGGSQWCALHRDARRFILGLPSDDPIMRTFRAALLPDEMFVHTVLANSPLKDHLINDDLHYIKWSDGAHPDPLNAADLPAIARSSAFFARKFAADDPLLDRIDHELLDL
jgi:hypothetical protein